jgi:hypothetical protein
VAQWHVQAAGGQVPARTQGGGASCGAAGPCRLHRHRHGAGAAHHWLPSATHTQPHTAHVPPVTTIAIQ